MKPIQTLLILRSSRKKEPSPGIRYVRVYENHGEYPRKEEKVKTTIVRAKGGTDERIIAVDDIQVPDLWHIAMNLKESGLHDESSKVLETWHLAIDLLRNLKEKE